MTEKYSSFFECENCGEQEVGVLIPKGTLVKDFKLPKCTECGCDTLVDI